MRRWLRRFVWSSMTQRARSGSALLPTHNIYTTHNNICIESVAKKNGQHCIGLMLTSKANPNANANLPLMLTWGWTNGQFVRLTEVGRVATNTTIAYKLSQKVFCILNLNVFTAFVSGGSAIGRSLAMAPVGLKNTSQLSMRVAQAACYIVCSIFFLNYSSVLWGLIEVESITFFSPQPWTFSSNIS